MEFKAGEKLKCDGRTTVTVLHGPFDGYLGDQRYVVEQADGKAAWVERERLGRVLRLERFGVIFETGSSEWYETLERARRLAESEEGGKRGAICILRGLSFDGGLSWDHEFVSSRLPQYKPEKED